VPRCSRRRRLAKAGRALTPQEAQRRRSPHP